MLSPIGRGDLLRLLRIAKTEEEMDTIAKLCGYERKPQSNDEEKPKNQPDNNEGSINSDK